MTLRELILKRAYAVAQAVPGIVSASCTRERAAPVGVDECPALDVSPESEPDPQPLGAGLDRRELTLRIRIYTAGDGAHELADPFVEAFHAGVMSDAALLGIVAGVIPGGADFERDDADQTVGRTTQRYRVIYTTRRGSLTA
mgnify:FL=1